MVVICTTFNIVTYMYVYIVYMILESDMKNYMYRSFWWRFVKTQSKNHNSHHRLGFCWKVFFFTLVPW